VGRGRQLCPGTSDVDFLDDLDSIVNLNTEVADSAFYFGVAEQELNCTQISGSAVDQGCFGSAKGMRTEFQPIETDAGDPLADQPCILSRRQPTPAATTPCEKDIASFPACQTQIIVKGLTRLFGQLEPDWSTCLLLPDCSTVESVAVRSYVIDPNCYDITAAQFAIDREVEQREVARASRELQRLRGLTTRDSIAMAALALSVFLCSRAAGAIRFQNWLLHCRS
jgi:hypothetical protein